MGVRDTVIAFGTVSGAASQARSCETAAPPDTRRIRMEDHLVLDPEATFYLRVDADAGEVAGVRGGDWLVVDRSVAPKPGALVIAAVDGELVLRRLESDAHGRLSLRDEQRPGARHRVVDTEASVWGVVSWTIRRP